MVLRVRGKDDGAMAARPARRSPSRPQDTGGPHAAFFVFWGLLGLGAWEAQEPGLAVGLWVLAVAWVAIALTLGARIRSHRLAVLEARSREAARYAAMTAGEFEEAVAFLCARDGCRDVRVNGGACDLGADVLAEAPDGRRMAVQCKRYGPDTKVGSPALQRFGGTCCSVHAARLAVVVTTSAFTKPATEYARQHGIVRVDGHALAAWASGTGPPPWRR
ncbi:restriction endonuclease [Streptomyces sp. ODS28]|uniref:restriction endonuclease n=1 Tax=Streptomyces sp. ODS28 TaxID=3136688 RepID=UPI0031E9F55E